MSMNNYAYPASDSTDIFRGAWRQLFGSMVQDMRESAGRSVEETARLAGMEASEWMAVEAGYISANPDWLRPMADSLEIRFEQLAPLVYICQGAWQD
jgi:transcriptional regulator with XRE-family HTH domain